MHIRTRQFRRWFIASIAAVSVMSLGATPAAHCQSLDEGQITPLIFHPQVMPEGAWWHSAGLTAIAPPPAITEEAQVRWPAFDYHGLYGLPKGFSLDGRAAVQVLQNRFSVGPKWVSRLGPVSVSLGWDVAYWFGYLDVGGFDSKAFGWESTPNVSVGYPIGEVAATLKAEALIVHSFTSYQGDSKWSINPENFGGWGFTLVLEQPFYGDQYLTLGFRALYSKFYWETWSLFSTFDRFLFYPEIIVGFIL